MRILLVEDDECAAKTLEKVLGNQRYVVDMAWFKTWDFRVLAQDKLGHHVDDDLVSFFTFD